MSANEDAIHPAQITSQPKKINYNLEILRGFAGLIVVFHHIIFHNKYFDPNFFPSVLRAFEPPGHFAVLIFFVLSGYVIGASHPERLAGKNILIYLKKRFVRIYPIYFIAVLLGLIVSIDHYSIPTILANFTLTQNIFYEVIWANSPSWSLNYEVLFYLLFIPISFFEIKPLAAFVICLVIGMLNAYLPYSPIITAYSFGYCFWLLGLYMARGLNESNSKLNLPACMFYILGIENIIGKTSFFNITVLISKIKAPVEKNDLRIWSQHMITLNDLLLIPYCFVLVLFFAGKDFRYKAIFFIVLQILPVFLVYSAFKHTINIDPQFYFGMVCLIIALFMYFVHLPDGYLRQTGLKSGSISYGLYIIHFPILFLFGRISLANDNLFFYIIRVILYLLITLLAAWILEKKLQPKFKKWLMPGNAGLNKNIFKK